MQRRRAKVRLARNLGDRIQSRNMPFGISGDFNQKQERGKRNGTVMGRAVSQKKRTNWYIILMHRSLSIRFYKQDIRGSIAHVTMLAKQGILTEEEKGQIINGLESIRTDVENGTLEITEEYEDIHSFVEANLIDRIGDAGKKLHTGRSRNDQVALDMKLYIRDEILELDSLLKECWKCS